MNKKKLLSIVFSFIFAFSFYFGSSAVLAQADLTCDNPGDLLGIDCVGYNTQLSGRDPRIIITNIINVVLGLLGIVATVLMLYAGFLWMTAGGEDGKVDKARKIIFGSIIGIIIILTAFAITRFVTTNIYQATRAY